jgi:hypothetical protein
MTYQDLQAKLHDNAFKPFRIRLVNNTTYDILEPWIITIGESSAIIVTHVRKDDRGYEVALDWRTISISHVFELSDIQIKDRDRKKKPA